MVNVHRLLLGSKKEWTIKTYTNLANSQSFAEKPNLQIRGGKKIVHAV